MPPKLNGFWMFAQQHKSEFKRQGLDCDTNDKLLGYASELWKRLSKEEKQTWDMKAKDQRKSKTRGLDRLDNVGNVIANRKDPMEEARKRREREISSATAQWYGKDLTKERFYIINFEHLVFLPEGDSMTEGMWHPREMAIVEYTLKEGITKTFHQFIWPDIIPEGYRFKAQDHSDKTHKIPLEKMEDFEDSTDFKKIWQQMLDTVKDGVSQDGQYPPLYCMIKDYERVRFMVDWLWEKSGAPLRYDNPLGKIFSLEEILSRLLAFSGKEETVNINPAFIATQLDGSQWDYTPNTVCSFHDKADVSRFCALACVRKCVYAISDMLAPHFQIDLTPNHVPTYTQSEPVGRLIPLDVMGWDRKDSNRRGQGRPAWRRGAGTNHGSKSGAGSVTSGMSDDEFVPDDEMEGTEQKLLSGYRSVGTARSVGSVKGGPWSREAGQLPVPASSQFQDADWPSLGGGAQSKSTNVRQSPEEFLSRAMDNVSLPVTSGLAASRGRGTTTCLPSPVARPITQPPPGLCLGVGRGLLPGDMHGVGRGMLPPSSRPPLARPLDPDSIAPSPVLHDSGPGGLARQKDPSSGRGMKPPSFGRGSMPKAGSENIDPSSNLRKQNFDDQSEWGMFRSASQNNALSRGAYSGPGVNPEGAGRGFSPLK